MKKFLLTILLMMPLCGSGEFDRVSFPRLYADAQMPLFVCELKVDHERAQSVILILAGEPKHKSGAYKQLDIVGAMTWPEFLEAMEERIDEN